MKKLVLFLLLALFVTACGDPAVDVQEVEYRPRITVEAYVYPGEQIKDIVLTRNFELEQPIDTAAILLLPNVNQVNATINGVPLVFDPSTFTYYTNIIGDYNTSYELKVSARIDGIDLETSAVTTTPSPGFDLLDNDLGDLIYRENPANIKFTPSPGTDFYAFSIRAENATLDNFIYDNPFIPDLTREDLEDTFNDFRYQYNLLINVDSYSSVPLEYEVLGLDTWFYSNYSVIVYAGDKNFKDFVLTAKQVQQPDGNFIEPAFHLEGDGIGVFASAVRDTLTFNLLQNN
ncbi:MAG: hypothetical protein SCALA702_09760 [Melioribacteraceae bacterium]|nr:MAG: hypothetical protein SCALA702_09760 [Melioribacteraceae bacterium]